MRRSLLSSIVGVVFAFLLIVVHPAQALTLSVGCDSLALVVAINTANSVAGDDTLNLSPGCFYGYTAGDTANPDNALPLINSHITINGNGAMIARVGGPTFRLFQVGIFSTLAIDNVVVVGGLRNDIGGGFYNSGTLSVTNSLILNNHASSSGGGIYSDAGTVTVTGSTFASNVGVGLGGGIEVAAGMAIVTGSTFSANTASLGAGIHNAGTLFVTGSTISGHTASAGGAIYNDNGTATVTASTISGNRAFGTGGGIYTFGTLTVTNTVISGNTAPSSTGISSDGGTVTVVDSTISGNWANFDFGAGISNFSGTLTVSNTIVWGNDGTQIEGVATVSDSIVQDGFAGTNVLNVDPLFVDPEPPSGEQTSAGDYHLQAASPALNVGSNAALPADTQDLDGDLDVLEPVPFDRDNNPRVVNTTVDMGAYEHQTVFFFPSELLDNGGFETDADLNKIPDGWTVGNGTGDKLTCKPGKPHAGLCAFNFKGGASEKAQLSQTVDLTGLTLGAGDTLTLSAFFNGNNPTAKGKFTLSVVYVGNPTPVKSSVKVKRNAVYTQIAHAAMTLTSGAVAEIKVTFKHQSTAGKILMDDASLIHTPLVSRRSDVLPPPLAPSGFRGSN